MADQGKILDISTHDLKVAAPTFSKQSSDLSDALVALKTALGNLGSPWGDDKQGKAFHAAYAPNEKAIKQSAGILVDGLASIHLALTDMADGHIDNDELVRQMFSKVGRKNEGGKGDQGGHG
ncbi:MULTISPECIES: hypothetical protein [unclassified Streptomyces]|uniref:hypothetical protein n=1 Tax=unclassified Streptomyces TaxID=2593676 RepID=UPI002DDBC925|nr:hypothetical protein [Streptomyces sp. NBC_01800]WSA67309.1 hypothetical protein OIE65_10145 [Streptomyces sp. NBC_01800]